MWGVSFIDNLKRWARAKCVRNATPAIKDNIWGSTFIFQKWFKFNINSTSTHNRNSRGGGHLLFGGAVPVCGWNKNTLTLMRANYRKHWHPSVGQIGHFGSLPLYRRTNLENWKKSLVWAYFGRIMSILGGIVPLNKWVFQSVSVSTAFHPFLAIWQKKLTDSIVGWFLGKTEKTITCSFFMQFRPLKAQNIRNWTENKVCHEAKSWKIDGKC